MGYGGARSIPPPGVSIGSSGFEGFESSLLELFVIGDLAGDLFDGLFRAEKDSTGDESQDQSSADTAGVVDGLDLFGDSSLGQFGPFGGEEERHVPSDSLGQSFFSQQSDEDGEIDKVLEFGEDGRSIGQLRELFGKDLGELSCGGHRSVGRRSRRVLPERETVPVVRPIETRVDRRWCR